MAIHLTETAAARVREQLAAHAGAEALRLGVRKSGCSGFAYVLDLAEHIDEQDNVFESHGVKVVVDADSLKFLDGTEVDYTRDGINAAFRFRNPNVRDECGCGESFRT